MQFTCHIDGSHIICDLTTNYDISKPVLAFAAMAPIKAIEGGLTVQSIGSYCEIALPDLTAGRAHRIVLEYDGGHKPANRAWLPMGPHLMVGDRRIDLPVGPLGCHPQPFPTQTTDGALPVIPQPLHWTPTGDTILINGFAATDPALRAVASLAERRGLRFVGDLPVTVETADLPTDAYEIDIQPTAVTIRASGYGGSFYAGITLLHLAQGGTLPCGTIKDAPRFDWRGQHLDTARHYYAPETLTRLLDLMALYKLNRFHWHFADDEAFRLEVECFPELWQQTAQRGKGHLLPALFSDSASAGGTYSKATAQQIIAHAAELNIEVLPEIEVPAHALALIRVFPDLKDPSDNGAETSVQGYRDNVINPAMARTWDVTETLAKEVGALFPFGHLHLGCDELPPDTWMGSPKARALMAEHDLDTTDDLQGWMMERLAKTVLSNGQRPCAWEEAAKGKNGGIGNGTILFSWTGQGPGVDAARAGYDVVMSPAQHIYLDMAHTSDPDDWGASWAAFVNLSDTVNWDPIPDPDIADRILGVEGTFWSEFTTQDNQIWPMLLPRICGVAVQAWHQTRPETDAFLGWVATQSWVLDAYGVARA